MVKWFDLEAGSSHLRLREHGCKAVRLTPHRMRLVLRRAAHLGSGTYEVSVTGVGAEGVCGGFP